MKIFLKIIIFISCFLPTTGFGASSASNDILAMRAIKNGNNSRLESLLSPQDINRPLLKGEPCSTLLMYAVSQKAPLTIIKTLLANGADATLKDNKGQPAILLLALKQNDPERLNLLLSAAKTAPLNDLLLQSIADRRSPEVIDCLIQRGADVNYAHRTGITPLIMAVNQTVANAQDTDSVIRLLLEAGADPQQSFLGISALELASANRELTGQTIERLRQKP